MRKEKRDCFRFTQNRVLVAVLVAVSIINLIVVGAVYSAAPFSPVSSGTSATTVMVTQLPLTESFTPTSTLTSTETLTPTATQTSTSTATQTPSITLTDSPTPTVCMPPVGWMIYIVRPGENLFRIGFAAGASAAQLKLANCLISDQIFPGQPLYVPRLPIYTPTPTSTPNQPTVFQNPSLCYSSVTVEDKETFYIYFSVVPYDPEGVTTVAIFYKINDGKSTMIFLALNGEVYSGSGSLSDVLSTNDTVKYFFRATDGLESVTDSIEDNVQLTPCYQLTNQ
jgi:LysM repeat protein